MKNTRFFAQLLGLAALGVTGAAQAHPGHTDPTGFAPGLAHLLDHALAVLVYVPVLVLAIGSLLLLARALWIKLGRPRAALPWLRAGMVITTFGRNMRRSDGTARTVRRVALR